MNPPRATLATIGMLLSLVACSEQTVVPTEPSRVAPMPSIPGSSSATVRTGREAEQYLQATAAKWSRDGRLELSRHLESQRAVRVQHESRAASRGIAAPPTAPSLNLAPDDAPSPTTRPYAIIYYSSTVPFVNGSSATIVSSVTYYGNIAITEVTYEARDDDGGVVIPVTTVANRGLGQNAPCLGSTWECSWTFKHQTVVSLNLGKDCGITVTASGQHTAQWTTPSAYRLPGAIWGSAFTADARASARNDPCAPPPVCLDPSAVNYGGSLPCTYPPPPPPPSGGGDQSGPPSPGGDSPPPTYEPAPYVPSGHWECTVWFMGTDYEREYCSWYYDYARIGVGHAARSISATARASANAQSAADLPSVFVIVSDQVPAGAMAVIERHRQGRYKNVLLVPSGALRPATLVAALHALAQSRDKLGETPAKDLQLTLKGAVLDRQIPAAARAYAASFASLIANARRADAGKYGVRPILELRLGDRK